LHLGVTEAGDGEDGRIKSAIGIGALLEDGIGDTIRVSLTEDPEFEIPVCKDLVKRYERRAASPGPYSPVIPAIQRLPYSPFEYKRRISRPLSNLGGHHVPVVMADFMKQRTIDRQDLAAIGYTYDAASDKWNIGDIAADFIYTGGKPIDFDLPGTLQCIGDYSVWRQLPDGTACLPLFRGAEYTMAAHRSHRLNFVALDTAAPESASLAGQWADDETLVLCCWSSHQQAMLSVRRFVAGLMERGIQTPVILAVESQDTTIDESLIHFSTEAGALFLDGMGDGIWLMNDPGKIVNTKISGRTYLETSNNRHFLNNTSFSILQATRTRISRTEYISCPSCGRTLFDLQETTAKIRSFTHHLKGVKIAIMGCIVNGPGEMADADFGYVGSGPGKITLYKGKEIVKRGVDSAVAMEELINLLKESEAWVDPVPVKAF
jgi:(E)-4-hydroxy-3-methylbut-2-enyl-diphosphate synthase